MRTGLFVLIAITILVMLTLWVTGANPLAGEKAAYEVWMSDAGGVRAGDQVRLSGVAVGRVESVELRGDREWPVVFRIELDEEVALSRESTARFSSDGILGSRFLSLVPGPPGAAPLEAGTKILGSKSGDMNEALGRLDEVVDRAIHLIDETTRVVQGLPEKIDPLLGRMNDLVSEQNVDQLSATLVTMRRTLDETGPRLPILLDKLDATLDDLGRGAGTVPEVAAQAEALLADLRSAVGPEGQRLSTLLDSAHLTLGDASQTLDAVAGNTGELETAIRDLRMAAANLRALSQELRERPDRLIRAPRKKDRRPGEGVER